MQKQGKPLVQIDLLGVCGGDQCVVYIKTRVSSPKEQKVQLEIGSDDGFNIGLIFPR